MNQTDLNTRHRAVLGRWWVTMRDTGGRPPQQMLDELAEVAEGVTPEREQLAIVLDRIAEHSPDATIRADIQLVATQLRGSGLVIINGPPSAAETASPKPAAATAPRRRQPAGPKITPVRTRGTK